MLSKQVLKFHAVSLGEAPQPAFSLRRAAEVIIINMVEYLPQPHQRNDKTHTHTHTEKNSNSIVLYGITCTMNQL